MANVYLQTLRKELGFDLIQMAEHIGISESFYRNIEYGCKNPSFGFVTKLKKAIPQADINLLIDETQQNKGESV